MPSSRGSSPLRNQTCGSYLDWQVDYLPLAPAGKPQRSVENPHITLESLFLVFSNYLLTLRGHRREEREEGEGSMAYCSGRVEDEAEGTG